MSQGSYHHRGGRQALLGSTIGNYFSRVADRYPEREAVVSLPQSRRLNYRQLAEAADKVARALLGLGFKPGDRVGIWSTNNIEWLILQIATAAVGIILVNINPGYRREELAYALNKSEVQGLFMIPAFRTSRYVEIVRGYRSEEPGGDPDQFTSRELPALRRVVVYDPARPDSTDDPGPGFLAWQRALSHADRIDPGELARICSKVDCDDPVNIQYTSGTTGSPKGVLLSHHNILNNACFAAREMGFTEADRLAVAVPFYHCFGMVLANLVCLSAGACLVIPCEHFDALSVLRAIDREKCTAVHGVPTMFIAELEHPEFESFNLSSLRTGIMAGAPCPPPLMKRVMEDMGCREILIGYGETEASPLTHLTRRDDSVDRRINTVGTNLPHQEVKVVDATTRRTLPVGEAGEVCFRGYHVMRGYFNDPDATAGAIDESGWLASGDIGVMDEDGYLRITGRLKEMIIRGGENIYPKEIEEVLFAHPAVRDVAVFGVPDEYYGEEIMAWLQLNEDAEADEADIRACLEEHLAHFKVPKYIRFVDDFPMTVTGKVQKFRMRESVIEEWQREGKTV